MLELTVKIILIGSFGGMALIAAHKIPVLITLPVEKKKVKRKVSFSDVLIVVKGKSKLFWKFLVERILLNLKNLAKKSFKEKTKPNLSEDYWEKVRRS